MIALIDIMREREYCMIIYSALINIEGEERKHDDDDEEEEEYFCD